MNHIHFSILLCLFGCLFRPRPCDQIISTPVLLQTNQIERNPAELSRASALQEQYLIVFRDIPVQSECKVYICYGFWMKTSPISSWETDVNTHRSSRRRFSVVFIILEKSDDLWLISGCKREINTSETLHHTQKLIYKKCRSLPRMLIPVPLQSSSFLLCLEQNLRIEYINYILFYF